MSHTLPLLELSISRQPPIFFLTHIFLFWHNRACVRRIKSSALLRGFTPNNCSAEDFLNSVKTVVSSPDTEF